MDVVSGTMMAAKIGTMAYTAEEKTIYVNGEYVTYTEITPADIDETGLVMLDTELDFVRWKAACDCNLILIGDPEIHSTIKQLADEGISRIDWATSPGELEYISNPYGSGCNILIIGGKVKDARRETTRYLIDLSTDDYERICANLCAGVLCPEKCYSCDLWAMECVDGKCVKDYIIEENSSKCGCDESTVPPSIPVSTDDYPTDDYPTDDYPTDDYSSIINVVLLSAVIILIVLLYQRSTRAKTKEKEEKTELKRSKTSVCPMCKNEIQEDWAACPHCGTRLKDDTRIY